MSTKTKYSNLTVYCKDMSRESKAFRTLPREIKRKIAKRRMKGLLV